MKNTVFPQSPFTLAYTDTDSFIYNIKVSNLVEGLMPHKNCLDFSEYPQTHPLYDPTNKIVLGKMKDEVKGLSMSEFCELRAKLYAFAIEGCGDAVELKKFTDSPPYDS